MREMERMLEWMSKEGFELDGRVEVHEGCVDTGRGVFTTETLNKGTVLFKVPSHCILNVQTSQFGALVESTGLHGWAALAVVIVLEYNDGPQSKFGPYLNALPKSFNTPLLWHNDFDRVAISILNPTLISVSQMMQEAKKILTPRARKILSRSSTQTINLWENFRWALAIVSAYSFTLDNGICSMLPFADFLNHKTGYNNARLFVDKDGSLAMETVSNVSKNSQLFNTYGTLSNAELLKRYGFVDDNNPHSFVVVSTERLFRQQYLFNRSRNARLRVIRRVLRKHNRLYNGSGLVFKQLRGRSPEIEWILTLDTRSGSTMRALSVAVSEQLAEYTACMNKLTQHKPTREPHQTRFNLALKLFAEDFEILSQWSRRLLNMKSSSSSIV